METYLDPTDASGAALFSRNITGEVVMLNLLKFRDVADYSKSPDLAPAEPISGREAYKLYMAHTEPFLADSGGSVLYAGNGGKYFIGPEDDGWDMVLLVQQNSLESFIKFATNAEYLAGIGHRSAALSDSRLLPLTALPSE